MCPSRFYHFCDTGLNRVSSKNLAAPASSLHDYKFRIHDQEQAAALWIRVSFITKNAGEHGRLFVQLKTNTAPSPGQEDLITGLPWKQILALAQSMLPLLLRCVVSPEQEIVAVRLIIRSVFTSTLLPPSLLCRPSRSTSTTTFKNPPLSSQNWRPPHQNQP